MTSTDAASPPAFASKPFSVDVFRSALATGDGASLAGWGPDDPAVVVKSECASTQNIAKDLATDGAASWTCVVAERQAEGRGRAGRSWTMLDGALAFSVILRPAAPPAKWVRLTSLAGLALVDTVRALGGEAQLKWPNDLIIAPKDAIGDGRLGPFRKVAGLLVDGVTRGANIEAACLGIGFNVSAAPVTPPLEGIAATLADIGIVTTRENALALLLNALENRLPAIGDDVKMEQAIEDLTAASFTVGKKIVATDGTEGVARGLDPDGALIVEETTGAKRQIWAGDVHFKHPPSREG